MLLRVFLSSSFRQNQHGLAQLVEKELKRVSQQLDKLSRLHHHNSHVLPPLDGLNLGTGEALSILLKTITTGEDKASGSPSIGWVVK